MADKGKSQHVRTYVRKPKGQALNDQLLFYGGLAAILGVGALGYFYISSQQAQQQQAQTQQQTAQPGIVGQPTILPVAPVIPGTAIITPGAVNPLGAFNTIFPIFGGAQFFTLTRRSCDPFLGGVPTTADLASQGIVITSYQANNIGGPNKPPICGVPITSITVGTTDPASAVKLQSLGFLPGTFGGGFLGGLWPRPLAGPPGFPPVPLPHTFPQPLPLPAGPPIFGGPPVLPPHFLGPPVSGMPIPPQFPPWWPFAGKGPWTWPKMLPRRHKKRRHRHHGDHDDKSDDVHFIGFPKHNFIKPIGHVINFNSH
jgi:hypothetical protein